MSLFQSREWWSYRPDSDEEYDVGGLAVGNLDNDPSQSRTAAPLAHTPPPTDMGIGACPGVRMSDGAAAACPRYVCMFTGECCGLHGASAATGRTGRRL